MNNIMRAATQSAFGPPSVIEIKEVPLPEIKAHELRVRIAAASVNSGDARIRGQNVPRGFGFIMKLIFGFKRPKFVSLGTSYAGTVDQVGSAPSPFRVGDRVVVQAGMKLGGHAEYATISAKSVINKIPDDMSFEVAAALGFGGLTALYFLKECAAVKPGDSVLVIGAGGAVGSAAVQLAKVLGARVTAVASGSKRDSVMKLGADEFIDYQQTPTNPSGDSIASKFDVVLDSVGLYSIEDFRRRLTPQGRGCRVVASLTETIDASLFSIFHGQKIFAGPFTERTQDVQTLIDLWKQKKYSPWVSQVLPFSEIVRAHELVESGHKAGNIVIQMLP